MNHRITSSGTFISRSPHVIFWQTWVLAVAYFLASIQAFAFPNAVEELAHGVSTDWVPFRAPGPVILKITGQSSCIDPVASDRRSGVIPRNLPLTEICRETGLASFDVWVHIFESGVGEIGVPVHCEQQAATATCETSPFNLNGRAHALLIHQGISGRGITRGLVEIRRAVGQQTALVQQPFVTSNMAFSLGNAPGPFDIVSVLVSDSGRTLIGNGDQGLHHFGGNADNDFLGADSTELWLMGVDGRILRADIAHSGVGPAGLIVHAEQAGSFGTTVVARPWKLIPDGFVLALNGQPVLLPDLTKITWDISPANTHPVSNPGRMRLVFNDWYNSDADSDGLSNRVETAYDLCTGTNVFSGRVSCETTAHFRAFPQARIGDPRDSDGDGLTDTVEVLGTDIGQGISNNIGATGCGPTADTRDADQLFPLWGFNPMHKDMLVELDRNAMNNSGLGGAAILSCMTPLDGCRTDAAVAPDLQPPLPANATDADRAVQLVQQQNSVRITKDELLRWMKIYRDSLGDAVRNPDGTPGIAVHFDVRIAQLSNNVAHPGAPDHVVYDPGASPGITDDTLLDGLVITAPGMSSLSNAAGFSPGLGSRCGCRAERSCPSRGHGSYGHWGYFQSIGGGGGASTAGGSLSINGLNGQAGAHELGHSLCLAHGGPSLGCVNGVPNPFMAGFEGRIDTETQNKYAYASLMNYAFAYSLPGFSRGERSAFPLPRFVVQNNARTLGFPETQTFGTASTAHTRVHSNSRTPGPNCNPAQGHNDCTAVDWNANGLFSGVDEFPWEGSGGLRGLEKVFQFPGLYCPNERRTNAVLPNAGGLCCLSGRQFPGSSDCVDPNAIVPPFRFPGAGTGSMNSFTQLGQPAAFVANGKVYSIFLDDDDWNAPIPSRRCESGRGCVVRPFPWNGVPRWVAYDQFRPNAAQLRQEFPCLGNNTGCSQSAGTGEILVQGDRSLVSGATQFAAATVMPGTPQEAYFIAMTSRSGLCPSSNPNPGCGQSWSAPTLWRGTGFGLERNQLLPVTLQLDGVAPFGVDSVALTAWNGTRSGDPNELFVVMREAQTQQLIFTTCDVNGACARVQPLLDNPQQNGGPGPQLTSTTMVALTTAPGENGLFYAYLAAGNLGVRTNFRGIDLYELWPRGDGFIRNLHPVFPSLGNAEISNVADHSSLQLAVFGVGTESRRMTLLFETPYGIFVKGSYTSVSTIPISTPNFYVDLLEIGEWDHSRVSVQVTGTPTPRGYQFEQGPGSIMAIVRDQRPALTVIGPPVLADGRPNPLGHMVNRVRGFRMGQERDGLNFAYVTFAEPTSLDPHYDYDDEHTLAWALCQTVDKNGGGTAGIDLLVHEEAIPAAQRLGRLTCPSGSSFMRGGGGTGNVLLSRRLFDCADRLGPLCHWPDPRLVDRVSRWLTLPTQFVTVSQPSGPVPPVVALNLGNNCSADYGAVVGAAVP